MPFFRINHSYLSNAFIFNALYSAIIFAFLFVFNDYIDKYIITHLEETYNFHIKQIIKLFIHTITTFLVAIIITLFLWYFFGWGNALRES